MSHIVVIGAGQAGASLVAKLRTEGFDGQVTLIGAETVPPYQRPPLSKAYLLGDMSEERLYLRPEHFYEDQRIDLKLASHVERIDPEKKAIHLADEVITYDQLALTTGSTPRKLPASIGGDLGNVFTVRDLADVDKMAPHVKTGKSVLIVGGGYIGLEAAAVCAQKGLNATLVEMADRILQRVASAQTSDYFRSLHTAHGVNIQEGVGLSRLEGDSHVSSAQLSDGSRIDVDFVIVGAGITPCDRLAADAGLAIENGIKTDQFGRTSDASIWAAGDCASFPWRGEQMRLESVQNAIDQAELVARNMRGAAEAYDPKPWFWSDQYDVKLQIAGLNAGFNHVVIRNAPDGLSHWYYKGDKLLAVDAMNDPRAFMVAKRLLEAKKSPDPDVVGDPSRDLKMLLRA
ncbi:NAD(P)/FAD-dependent oxidoreductase [Nereida sp. MMG025]|uniref:NAD(P)/FAD-dependent oxidoreductase n=1 Tax=Nereida sp. MMG025 TaxID=2909981 RepID=UPI001F32AAD5|nr:FAD-dependent oxidoreductase [Nereida sp. MMG025]MCF6444429.1 FAD-dependent oxidoreductase [Nereida sp. MMG025]